MEETIGLLGGDARMDYLARLLQEDGYGVRTWGRADAPGACPKEEAAASDRIVLPAPLSRGGCLTGTTLAMGELWRLLTPAVRVYAGAAGEDDRRRARHNGIAITDYLEEEALAVQNAVPTAEGAIACAMERMPVTLCGTPCLVIGFGRIGKLLARRLQGLGAVVSVSARKHADLAWIEALGYAPLETRCLDGRLGAFRVIFNTVPSMVLREKQLSELRQDCLLVELSSQEGFGMEQAQALGLPCVRAGGLPGRAAPETAARAIRDALYEIWEDEKK